MKFVNVLLDKHWNEIEFKLMKRLICPFSVFWPFNPPYCSIFFIHLVIFISFSFFPITAEGRKYETTEGKNSCTDYPKIYCKSLLHLLRHTSNLYLMQYRFTVNFGILSMSFSFLSLSPFPFWAWRWKIDRLALFFFHLILIFYKECFFSVSHLLLKIQNSELG